MPPKNIVSAERKAEMVGYYLPGYATLATKELVSEIPELGDVDYEEGNMEIIIEMIAFYMHVANRLAFRDLGSQTLPEFSKRLTVAVANAVAAALNDEISSVVTIAQLRDKYNERESEYAQYAQFVPEGDEPMEKTLFWEFAKVMFNRFRGSDNTFDLLQMRSVLLHGMLPFLKKTNLVLNE